MITVTTATKKPKQRNLKQYLNPIATKPPPNSTMDLTSII